MTRKILIPLLFTVCVLLAFAMRTWHYSTSVYNLGKMVGDVPQSELTEPSAIPRYHRNFAPFTIESAMMYAYAEQIALGRGVPESDPLLNGMEDIPPYAQMSMGLEWFLGWGWRIKNAIAPDPEPTAAELRYQDHPRMAQWMSAQLRLWASLSSGLIFLWLVVCRCPLKFALPAGLLHAVSPAAIARATGQDIVRGEFCIPLILGAFVLAHSIYSHPKAWKYILLYFVTVLAFAAWDLCQMMFGCWALYELFRFTLGRKMTATRGTVWLVLAAAVLTAAVFVPTCQLYCLWRSLLVCAALPSLLLAYLYTRKFQRKPPRLPGNAPQWLGRTALVVVSFGFFYIVWQIFINTPEYASIYSHFTAAMRAKIQFWNVKPLFPEQLTYDARILWTPSMNSTTWESACTFFPSLQFRSITFKPLLFVLGYLPLSLTLFAVLLAGTFLFTPVKRIAKRYSESSLLPYLFTVGFTVSFIYISRYHEFVILFLCLALAFLCRDYAMAFKRQKISAAVFPWQKLLTRPYPRKLLRWLPLAAFIGIVGYETVISSLSRRYYTGDVPLKHTAELIQWMRTKKDVFSGHGVAAGLTLNPMLRAYVGCGVVMNPQFGIKRLRDATEEYLTALYHGTEDDVADYCRRHHAKFVLFVRENPNSLPLALTNAAAIQAKSREQFDALKRQYTANWIYSNRYIANALQIPGNSAYRAFYSASGSNPAQPGTLKHFKRIPMEPPFEHLNATHAIFELTD